MVLHIDTDPVIAMNIVAVQPSVRVEFDAYILEHLTIGAGEIQVQVGNVVAELRIALEHHPYLLVCFKFQAGERHRENIRPGTVIRILRFISVSRVFVTVYRVISTVNRLLVAVGGFFIAARFLFGRCWRSRHGMDFVFLDPKERIRGQFLGKIFP